MPWSDGDANSTVVLTATVAAYSRLRRQRSCKAAVLRQAIWQNIFQVNTGMHLLAMQEVK